MLFSLIRTFAIRINEAEAKVPQPEEYDLNTIKKHRAMVKITKEAALAYHVGTRPGKIEVKPTKPYRTQTDLSLAYSPGVAYPCLEIQENPDAAYRYTDKGLSHTNRPLAGLFARRGLSLLRDSGDP